MQKFVAGISWKLEKEIRGFFIDLKGLGCADGRWIELAQDHVRWRLNSSSSPIVSVFLKLSFYVLSWFIHFFLNYKSNIQRSKILYA